MYNPIQIIFKCKSIDKNSDLHDKELSVHILPYPNQISIKKIPIFFPSQVKGYLKNINSSHSLIQQIQSEMLSDFQIEFKWEDSNNEFDDENLAFLNSDQEEEGYILKVGQEYLIIHAATIKGLFYGFQTLRQIIIGAKQIIDNKIKGFNSISSVELFSCIRDT